MVYWEKHQHWATAKTLLVVHRYAANPNLHDPGWLNCMETQPTPAGGYQYFTGGSKNNRIQ